MTSESRPYFDLVSPTYIEAWPESLSVLSIPGTRIELTRELAISLGKWNGEWGQVFWEVFGEPNDADDANNSFLKDTLGKLTGALPNGGFVRLGSRSPKDSWEGHKAKFRADTGAQAFEFLTDSSERIHDDLMLALHNDYLPSVYVREWIPILPQLEFRCFMRGRELVGISQYEYRDLGFATAEQIAVAERSQPLMETLIRDWFTQSFREASHLDDVVFDVFIRTRKISGRPVTTVHLLEINPYSRYTDPCLFDWSKPEMFDGRFLYRLPTDVNEKIELPAKYTDDPEIKAILDGRDG